jgi:hypothetical protein
MMVPFLAMLRQKYSEIGIGKGLGHFTFGDRDSQA